MKYTATFGLVLSAALFLTGVARAGSITVPNFSFELSNSEAVGSNHSVITGWVENGAEFYGIQDNNGEFNNTGTVAKPAYGAFDGSQYAFINVSHSEVATLTSAAPVVTSIAANSIYVLTVALGNHTESDSVDYGQPGNQTISLLANNVVIPGATFTLTNGTLAEGVTKNYSVSFTTVGANAIYDTEALTIQLMESDEGISRPVQSGFDNVRLATAIVPEPGTWALMLAGAVLFAGFSLRRQRA